MQLNSFSNFICGFVIENESMKRSIWGRERERAETTWRDEEEDEGNTCIIENLTFTFALK